MKPFYGRRRNRALTKIEEGLLSHSNQEWPHVSEPIWFEIGFGSGEHVINLAENNLNQSVWGIEAFDNGAAAALKTIQDKKLDNIYIRHITLHEIIESWPQHVLCEKIFLMFSDPWPKKRHAKRRVIQQSMLIQLADITTPGGMFYVASDDPVYQAWVVEQFGLCVRWRSVWKNQLKRPDELGCVTRYEQKAINAGRTPQFWIFQKI